MPHFLSRDGLFKAGAREINGKGEVLGQLIMQELKK
jgi:hypothetical protein